MPQPTHYDAIIVGLGSMGSAAACHLAARGKRILGLDLSTPPHALGSHGGLSRMIRLVYAEHTDYVPLLQRGYELWRKLERDTAQQILHVTGGVYIGPETSRYISGAIDSAEKHNLAYDVVEHRDIPTRYPWFRVPAGSVAIDDPAAGFLYPHRAIEAHLTLARAAGADLHTSEPVLDWQADSKGVRVRTAQATYTADRLILTAGAWMPKLLAPSLANTQAPALNLTTTRQTLCWVDPPDPAPFTLGRFPCWAFTLDGTTVYYGFPITPDGSGGRGLKLAHHAPFTPVDPDTDPRTVRPGDEQPPLNFLRNHMPSALGTARDVQVCLYTNTPDEHFAVGMHPTAPNVVVASPCSGHGFKFASVIGEVLADLAEGGAGSTRFDINFIAPDRVIPVR